MPALDSFPKGDAYFQFRIHRATLVAFLVSILLHALILFFSWPLLFGDKSKPAPVTLTVQLAPPVPKAEPIPVPIPEPKPLPKPVEKPVEKAKPKIMTSKAKTPSSIPIAPVTQAPAEAVPPPAAIPPPVAAPDLESYMRAMRERRQRAEQAPAREYAPIAPERSPTTDEIRMANIKRNLQMQGTNGLFQIMSMGVSSAQFSFRGWTNDFSNARREVIEVEVEPGADLQRAVIRKMIEIIRRHYNGDFNWESIRLGRVVVMSARPEDTAGLEDFMLKEFFGPGIRYPAP